MPSKSAKIKLNKNMSIFHGMYYGVWDLPCVSSHEGLNHLRTKFFRGNINLYFDFMSFLYIDMTEVVEILPQIRQGPTHST